MSRHFVTPANRSSERGAVLVSTLLILTLLVFVMASIAWLIVNRSSVIAIEQDQVALENLTVSGLELGVYRVMSLPIDRAVEGQDRAVLSQGQVDIVWRGENARMDLNTAPKNWIEGLIKAVGSPSDDADAVARDIVERRKETTAKKSPSSHTDRQGPFAHPSELLSVNGMSPALYHRLAPFITLYSSWPSIDPRIASETLLSHLPEMTPVRLQTLLSIHGKSKEAANSVLEGLGVERSMLAAERSLTTRFTLKVRLKNGLLRTSEIIAAIFPNDAEPYRILYWSSDPNDP